MPNRIIKESICTSENLAQLSCGAERLFYRLMVQVDDYGLFFANPKIVKSKCFPLIADDIKSNQVQAWMDELEKARLILFYQVDGNNYLKFTKWSKHQRKRADKPKFPLPIIVSEIETTDDGGCCQMTADDGQIPPREGSREKEVERREKEVERSIREKKTERAVLVLLSDIEMDALVAEHGEDATTWMINKLSNYKQANGKKYKSDAAAIRSWVVKTWVEDNAKPPGMRSVAVPLPEWLKKGGGNGQG